MTRRGYIWVIAVAVINVLIHIAVYDNLEYHRDELLYFSLGLHPAAGYATVPPMIGWIARLMQMIAGFSLFSVKIFPALMGGVFIVLCAAVTRELGGKAYAQVLTSIAVLITPFALRAFYLFQPVHLDVFFWTLLIYIVLRYINTLDGNYLIAAGATAGLAMLNKYMIALLLPSILIPIVFTMHRSIFSEKKFYAGLVMGFLIFMPNLVWQIVKGFPVTRHLRELSETQLVHVSMKDFFADQAMMTLSSFILVIAGIIYLAAGKKYRFLFFTVAFVITTLLLLHGKSYYTLGILPLLIAGGAVAAESLIRSKILRALLPLLLILLSLPAMPVGIPIFKKEKLVGYFKMMEEKYGVVAGRRFEDGTIHSLPQDYADQLGWEELASIAYEAYRQVPEKNKCMIFCDNYGQAGAIAVIGRKYGLPEPLSFNESFRYWLPRSFDPDIEYVIYIDTGEPGKDVSELFRSIRLIGKVSDIHAREYGTSVWLCSDPATSFNEFWTSRIKDKDVNK